MHVVANDNNGKVTFANDVIAVIAGLAATEIEGVAGMSGSIMGDIAEILGRKNLTKGVKVEVGEEEAAIDLYIIVDYGVKIHEVCENVQKAVKTSVENMTDLKVVEVNVFIQGVNLKQDEPVEPEEPVPPRVK
ncbi:MAG: Asp23/Gls24 family envelope stress response protein [Clostridia bacterium]|nr:Asp23/Gls24 family envelope stress response protein [Clostridia bacterium]